MGTDGLNAPENGGNMTWDAALEATQLYGCEPASASLGHRWARCPSIEAGLSLWFDSVATYYRSRVTNLEEYFNTYNPCSDPGNIAHGFPCGTENGRITIGLVAEHAGLPAYPEVAGTGDGWYRYQGEESSLDSYFNQQVNCGPTSVAMAIQHTRGLYVPIRDIREFTGRNGSGTDAHDLMGALDHWGVPYSDAAIRDVEGMRVALTRGNPIIMSLSMAGIRAGADYEGRSTDPVHRVGRFSSFAGDHWLVVKGMSADGRYFVVYDPNVWGGPGTARYWYADGTPKGQDRLYSVGEFRRGIESHGSSYGIEILPHR